jgi:oxysterol-binding protein 1
LTCEDEPTFFDSVDHFVGSENGSSTMSSGQGVVSTKKQDFNKTVAQIRRRMKLPEPAEKEKGISLWSIIKDSVGKDLTRVCLPVYFNEPLSSLQKCFEDLEYSYLLDQAYQHGKVVRSASHLMHFISRTLNCFMISVRYQ